MVVKKVWLIPVAASLCGFGAMFTGYAIGVLAGHFPSIIPFISDGGAFPPEGCIFAQLLNTGSFFLILTCYIRHRQTVEYYGHRLHWENSKWRVASLFLMWTGITTAIGITFVANFPESEVLVVHGLAASITFIAALIYCWGQVLIGYCMVPRMASMLVNHLRLVLCVTATIAMIMHEVALVFQPFIPKGMEEPGGSGYQVKWYTRDSPFFVNHAVATSSEWIMVSCIMLMFLSFAAELRFAYAHAPRVVFRRTSSVISDSRHVKIVQVPTTSGAQLSSDW